MQTVKDHYIDYLREGYLARFRRNSAYSLASFARDLGISPSHLSLILNGKRGVSIKQAVRFSKCLHLSEVDSRIFCTLVEAKHARSALVKKQASQQLEAYRERVENRGFLAEYELSAHEMEDFSEWYVLSVFESLKVKNPPKTVPALAKRLQITAVQASHAIALLKQQGLIEETVAGWLILKKTIKTSHEVSSASVRRYQRSLLEKAQTSLETDALEKRHMISVVMPYRQTDLNKIKIKCDQFLKKMIKDFSHSGEGDEVGALLLQFFPVSRSENEEKAARKKDE